MKSSRNLRLVLSVALGSLCLLWSGRAADLSTATARPAPAWLSGAVIYEVYPRAFSAEGNFNGITARLGELHDLGVDVLWLMPIHPIGALERKGSYGSPYAVRDYLAINPDYGSPEDLQRLVTAAHGQKMRVILDVVLNHSAWDNRLMTEHPEFYKHDEHGKIIPPVKEWTDVAGFDYTNPQLRAYMIGVLQHWVTTFGVDGFRCDVAGMVPVGFWNEARVALEKIKPDVLMLAEASQPDLLLHAFDLDYSWPLHGKLNEVLLRGAPASDLQRSWEDSRQTFPQGARHMRISDNHDEARAVARFGVRGALAASVLMFTLDGVPLLYNGMEVGDATESGDPALFERLPVFWHPKERPPLRDIYRELIQMRKSHSAFGRDGVEWLRNTQPADLLSFRRSDADDEFVVVINLSNRPVSAAVEAGSAVGFKPLVFPGMGEPTSTDLAALKLTGFEWRIFHRPVAKP